MDRDLNCRKTNINAKIEKFSEGEEIVLVQHPREATTNNIDVTMISQFSVNRLDTFAKAIEAWPGPISVAM